MARVDLKAGASIDVLTKEELDSSLTAAMRTPYQAVSMMRLPVITATAVAGVLAAGGDTAPEHGPDSGYVLSVRHLAIIGLTRGATPDVVRILRGQLAIWELNGNQSFQTWGRGEIMLMPGETLSYQSFGTFAATGQIQIHGMGWHCPAQFAAELVA